MSVREISFGVDELVHPQNLGGRVQFASPEFMEFVDRLRYGDPVLGWQGDPRLGLYHEGEGGGWIVVRYEADGTYRDVCRSRPGLALDERLLLHLMAHDMRGHAGFDPDSLAEGDRPYDETDERLQEAIERVAHGLAKDLA